MRILNFLFSMPSSSLCSQFLPPPQSYFTRAIWNQDRFLKLPHSLPPLCLGRRLLVLCEILHWFLPGKLQLTLQGPSNAATSLEPSIPSAGRPICSIFCTCMVPYAVFCLSHCCQCPFHRWESQSTSPSWGAFQHCAGLWACCGGNSDSNLVLLLCVLASNVHSYRK